MVFFKKSEYSNKLACLGIALVTPWYFVSSDVNAQSYQLETFATLQSVVDDLNAEGYTDLANAFVNSGFHPDGIKLGKSGTPTAGNLYVSSIATGAVLEFTPDGKAHPYVNPKPKNAQAYGTFVDSQGDLFIAYQKALTNVGGIDVVLAGTPTPADGKVCYAIPNNKIAPNDLVVTKDRKSLYFTDGAGGQIFKCAVTLGAGSVDCSCQSWLKNSNTKSLLGLFGGVDGLVLDSSETNLYFDNYLQGKIFQVSINADGSPGKEEVIMGHRRLYGNADGMSLSGDANSVYTTAFEAGNSTVSNVVKTDMATGTTQVVISEAPWDLLNPGASITAAPDETLYISAVDLKGLGNYQRAGTDGGKIVKATLSTK
jgi:sugar lactone lactonase YvrE